jgi:hypothetical protein
MHEDRRLSNRSHHQHVKRTRNLSKTAERGSQRRKLPVTHSQSFCSVLVEVGEASRGTILWHYVARPCDARRTGSLIKSPGNFT